jgi:hypothetical protein
VSPLQQAGDDRHQQIDSLRDELAALKRELHDARHEFATTMEALRRDLDQLNQQLGN